MVPGLAVVGWPCTGASPGLDTPGGNGGSRGEGAAERWAALDQALAALQMAASGQEATSLESKLRQLRLNASSQAVTLLLGRGLRELSAGAHEEALRDFDAALTLDPRTPRLGTRSR